MNTAYFLVLLLKQCKRFYHYVQFWIFIIRIYWGVTAPILNLIARSQVEIKLSTFLLGSNSTFMWPSSWLLRSFFVTFWFFWTMTTPLVHHAACSLGHFSFPNSRKSNFSLWSNCKSSHWREVSKTLFGIASVMGTGWCEIRKKNKPARSPRKNLSI